MKLILRNQAQAMRYSRTKIRGLSLIEILVTLAITAIVLLGLVGLQTYSVRMQSVASYQSAAALAAADMADRMRANNTAALDYAGKPYAPATMPTALNSCTTCTVSETANNDLVQWVQQLGRILPGGKGTVTLSLSPSHPTPPHTYNISVTWNEPAKEGDTANTVRTYNFTYIP